MNRNVLIGVGLVVVIIVLMMILMPGANEPAGGDATAPATNDATTPAAPAPSN